MLHILTRRLANKVYTAHRDLYRKAGIIHRDVSLGNLMVLSQDVLEGHGVLIDLDYAARIDVPNHFTGAGTYAYRPAHLLLVESYQVHYPWLDLESFYYCLLDVLEGWNGGYAQDGVSYITLWCNDNRIKLKDGKVGDLKLEFLRSADLRQFPLIDGREFSLAKLQRLRAMFARGYHAMLCESTTHAGRLAPGFDMSTMGGHVTHESFLAILEDDSDVTEEEINAILADARALAEASAAASSPAPTPTPSPPPLPRRSKRLAAGPLHPPRALPAPTSVRRSKRVAPPPVPAPHRHGKAEPCRCSGRTLAGVRCKRTATAVRPALDTHGKHYCHAHRTQGDYARKA